MRPLPSRHHNLTYFKSDRHTFSTSSCLQWNDLYESQVFNGMAYWKVKSSTEWLIGKSSLQRNGLLESSSISQMKLEAGWSGAAIARSS